MAKLAKATPEKCENQFNSMILDIKQIKDSYERSGQCDRGLTGGNNDERGAMDIKANFVTYHQPYLLYLWHMLKKHDLMVSLMQRLH